MPAPQPTWIQYTDSLIGLNHPTKTDVLNRVVKYILVKCGMDVDTVGFTGFRAVFNVKAYGALGNGVTDDTAAINLAFAAAAINGGRVHFPAGTYIVSAPIVVTRKITVSGDGQDVTYLSKNNTTTATGVSTALAKDAVLYLDGPTPGNFAFGVVIRDLTTTTTSSASGSCGVYLGNVAKSKMDNVNCQGGYNGVLAEGCWMFSLKNVRGGSNNGYSFEFSSNTDKTSLALENCYSEASAGGFNFNRARYSSMRSCGTDYCNSGNAPGNPYGTNAKGNYTSLSVCYNFVATTMSMTGCGAEFAYCDFIIAQSSSAITVDGCYVAAHSLSYTGASRSAFISTADLDGTDNRIIISGCDFGAVTKTGSGSAIYGYFAGGTVSQIQADRIQPILGTPLAQTSGRVYDRGNVLRGVVPMVQSAGQVYSQSNSILQTTAVATTHYTLTAPGVYDIAAYGYGGVNFAADATVVVSSTGVLSLLRTNSTSASFVISVTGSTVKITQSNGSDVTVGSTLLNRMLA